MNTPYDFWKIMTVPNSFTYFTKIYDQNNCCNPIKHETYQVVSEHAKNILDQQVEYVQKQSKEALNAAKEFLDSHTQEQFLSNQQKLIQHSLENVVSVMQQFLQEMHKINNDLFNMLKKSTNHSMSNSSNQVSGSNIKSK